MIESIDNGIWPQAPGSNACGVENAIAMANYDSINKGQTQPFTNSSAQTTVEHNNQTQTSGESQWGYATPKNTWAGYTNIAPDGGTDPRSVAYMAWNYTIANTFYHDYIYRWTFAHAGQIPPPFSQQVLEATTKLGVALEQYSEPVSVAINGGMHLVLVTGLWSATDPMTSFPAQIQGLVYRDPEGDYSSDREEIDYSVWAGGNYGSGLGNQFGTYSLWSLYYGDKYAVGDGLNTFDPEPSVGPYAGAGKKHWYGGFTWIRLDNNYTNGQWSPDWAYNSINGQQILYE